MMSAIIATGLLILCNSAMVKTEALLCDMTYTCITYSPSSTLLTGTPYNFGLTTAFTKGRYTRWESLSTPTLVLTVPVLYEETFTARSMNTWCSTLGVMTSIINTKAIVVWNVQGGKLGKDLERGGCSSGQRVSVGNFFNLLDTGSRIQYLNLRPNLIRNKFLKTE